MYCKNKLSSQCERTNVNATENGMYGGTTAGMFGVSRAPISYSFVIFHDRVLRATIER